MTAVESNSDAFKGTQAATTSFFGLGGDASVINSIHIQWDATLVATGITVWASNLPPTEVAVSSVVAGDWIQLNPPTGYTAISPPGAATAATPLVLAIPGGTAGGAFLDIGNTGAKRLRVQVVCTTPGFLRIRGNGKY